jgi:multidrug resistance efflux pump
VNLAVILDLITAREATTGHTAERLREQITALTADLARAESELADLKVTRTTLRTLAAAEFTADDPTIASAPYQQILTVLHTAPTGIRAKDICLALGVDPIPKHVESARAKLKRMVKHHVLTEHQPGVFTLTQNGPNLTNRPLRCHLSVQQTRALP